jgi:hypothetical protein
VPCRGSTGDGLDARQRRTGGPRQHERDVGVGDLSHGVGTGAAYDAVRAVVDPLDEDRPSDGDIDALAALVRDGRLDAVLFDAVDEME